MKKEVKKVPHFRNESEERDFWDTHDSTEYFDYSDKKRINISIVPETKTQLISIRFPEGMIQDLKTLSKKYDVSYQSLIKLWIADRLRQLRKAA